MNDDAHLPADESQIPTAEVAPGAPTQTSRWPGRLLFVLILLAAIPVIYSAGRSEIARWYRAASTDAIYRGEREEALDKMNQAVAWDPNNLECLTGHSGILLSLRDTSQAAAVADKALAITRRQRELRDSKNTQLQLASVLNQSAYSHALDESNLKEALAAADEAVALMANHDRRSPSVLDTRGYLHYLVAMEDESIREEELEKALEDMEEAVRLNDQIVKLELGEIQSQAKLTVDRAPLRHARRVIDEGRAVMHQHRGLVYEAIGKTNAAQKDLAEAKRLGYDPANGVW